MCVYAGGSPLPELEIVTVLEVLKAVDEEGVSVSHTCMHMYNVQCVCALGHAAGDGGASQAQVWQSTH